MKPSISLLASLLLGCSVGEPDPVPLDLELDEDATYPSEPVPTLEELAEKHRQRLREELESIEVDREADSHDLDRRYRPLDVSLDGGPTFDRVAKEVLDASSITLSDHPVRLAGLRYYEVSAGGGSCLYGWRSIGCFLGEEAVHCETLGSTDSLVAFVRAYGLDEHPERLSEDQWLHLVGALVGGMSRFATASPDDGSRHRVSLGPGRLGLGARLLMGHGPWEPGKTVELELVIEGGEIRSSLTPDPLHEHR